MVCGRFIRLKRRPTVSAPKIGAKRPPGSKRRAVLYAKPIGFQDLPGVGLDPKKIEEVDRGDFIREKILIRVSEYAVMPVYLLKPKSGRTSYPVVLAFAGHGYGVKDIVGLWEDGSEREEPDGIYKDFAVALCRKGFLVAAPEISCFGERQTDFSYLDALLGQPVPETTCTHTALLAFHLGGSAVGMRVQEGKRLVDYISTRKDADISRLGAMGLSGGGMHTFFSACLDVRIKACVVSGYFSTFKNSILAMNHCPCNVVPGLHKFGEEYDLIGLIAPSAGIDRGSHSRSAVPDQRRGAECGESPPGLSCFWS